MCHKAFDSFGIIAYRSELGVCDFFDDLNATTSTFD